MLATTATLALAVLFSIAVYSVYSRRREVSFELVPNQLLTRRPLVFLTGDRSFFYFTRYWNQIPSYLTEHGFEVYKAPLPWKKGAFRTHRIRELFASWEKQNFSCHLFVDLSLYSEISNIILENPSVSVRSLNVVCGSCDPCDANRSITLRSLPIAWREVKWNESRRSSLYWRAHRLISRTPVFPSHLGVSLDEELTSALLEHLKFLAERDFAMPN